MLVIFSLVVVDVVLVVEVLALVLDEPLDKPCHDFDLIIV